MNANNDLDEWIDRSISRFMKLTDPVDPTTFEPTPTNEETRLTDYFNRLRNAVNNYEDYVRSGSSEFKNELLNLIKEDYHIVKLRIEVKPAATIKDIQQHIFEKEIYYKSG